jgi:hypothetical protein
MTLQHKINLVKWAMSQTKSQEEKEKLAKQGLELLNEWTWSL